MNVEASISNTRRGADSSAAGVKFARVAAWLLLCAASAWAAEIRWQAPLEIASGAGERGAWQQNESRYDFVDDPTVAWSPRGELAVAWVDQRRKAVLLQRYSADAEMLLAPVDISRQPQTFSWLPRLAWAPDGAEQLYVLWQEIIFSGGSHGGEILFGVSDDGGRSFSQPMNLSRSSEGDGKGRINRNIWHNGSLDIATAPGGLVFAAWTEYDGRLWFARSSDGGRNFSSLLVAGDPPSLPARAPALAVGIDGAVVLAWATGDDPAADIRIARSGDGGRSFSAPRPVAITPDYSDAPKLAFDTRAVLHLVHAEGRGGPFQTSTIRHLRSTDGGRSFGPAREISSPLPRGYASAGYPALGVDGRGRVVVIWELLRASSPAPPYGLAIAISADGVVFSAPQLIPGSVDPGGGFNGSTQGLLMKKLAVRADGEIAVVNSAVKIGSHSRVWLLRGTCVEVREGFGGDSASVPFYALKDSPVNESPPGLFNADPGQALASKIGQLTISRLRANVERGLGVAFDVREFHEQVLDTGALRMTGVRSEDRCLDRRALPV
jgi:hypothetical protein